MKRWMRNFFTLLGAVIGITSCDARGSVTPACIFTDHMVLQHDSNDPVWGTAAPGERVTVVIAG